MEFAAPRQGRFFPTIVAFSPDFSGFARWQGHTSAPRALPPGVRVASLLARLVDSLGTSWQDDRIVPEYRNEDSRGGPR
jgi:hypothetical protein